MKWDKLLSTTRIRTLLGEDKITDIPDDFRSEIERDYGRTVFSTPVKRLQDKAQVFPLEPIDSVRTRLTHSLEVSSVAKSLCRLVARQLEKSKKVSRYQAEDIETIGQTCGLLHDIGNPPFGHSGEDAIRAWFKDKVDACRKEFVTSNPGKTPPSIFGPSEDPNSLFEKDILTYEGNAQTLRLVSRLQVFSDRRGLNLTSAVVSSLCKYTSDSSTISKHKKHLKKLGHYQSEKHIAALVSAETGTGDARHPLAYLIEASDDICYLLGDLEDAIKKEIIDWDLIAKTFSKTPEGKKLIDQTGVFISTVKKKKLHSKSSLDECAIQYFRVKAMIAMVDAIAKSFHKNYTKIMNGKFDSNLVSESSLKDLFEIIDIFSKNYVYTSKETIRLEILGYKIIRDLLDIFDKAKASAPANTLAGKTYRLISHNYRSVYEAKEDWEKAFPDDYRRVLLVTDYICGMTDTFALRLHNQLTQGIH